MSTSNQNLFAALRAAFPADLEQIAVETMSASGEPLLYSWRERFRATLEALGNDLFAVEGVSDFRFRVVRKAGKVIALERINRDGTTDSYARLD